MMDNRNITMKEYIRLEEEKARRHGKVYNWETATYRKIWYDDDIHDLRSVETEFPAIVFNDELTSEKALSCEPIVSSLKNNKIDFRISFDKSDDEDYTIIFDKNSFSYKIISVNDLKTYSENDNEKVNMPSFPLPEPTIPQLNLLKFLIVSMNLILKTETSLPECDEEEQNIVYFNDLFPFNIIYPNDLKSDEDNEDNEIDIIHSSEDMALPPRDQRHQYLRFEGLQYTNADIADFETRLGKIYEREVHRVQVFDFGGLTDLMAEGLCGRMLMEHKEAQGQESGRQISDKGDLSAYWREISSEGDFLGVPPSYTHIQDPMLRLCHRLISCIIAGRSQAHKKVTVTDLFYLRVDVGSVNIPYLLARLLTVERLQGLTMIMRDLPVIDMTELPDVAADAPEIAEGAPNVVEGDQAVPTPVQEPQPPPAARTISQRLARLEEDVHGIHVSLGEQHEVADTMARDFSKFTVWAAGGIAQLLDSASATYIRYSETHVPYQRRRVR
ncbi:hypothetical protein Tco_1118124 [Tanacetum coccineum]